MGTSSLSSAQLEVSLPPGWRRWLFVATMVALSAGLAWYVVRITLAATWGASYDVARVRRAIALDPNNAELHSWLATLYLAGAGSSPSDAVAPLQRAVQLNPRTPDYWLNLGRACFVAADTACARQAFDRAVQLAPMRPNTEWETATYYVISGQADTAFAHFRRFLELSPARAKEVFQLTGRVFADPSLVWANLVSGSHHPLVRSAFLETVASAGRFDLTGAYWADTARSTPNLSFGAVQTYLQQLIAAEQYEQASSMWEDLVRMGIVTRRPSQGSNLVFNGDFAQPILNAGFDWQTRPVKFVTLDFSEPAPAGGYALLADFTVPHNADEEPLYQLVPVAPGRTYTLTAFVRSEGIRSDSGPRLRVQDPQCLACVDQSTEGTTGTKARHKLALTFATGSQTQVVRVSLWRPRSRVFPMDIQGQFWLDSVALKPAPNAVAEPRP